MPHSNPLAIHAGSPPPASERRAFVRYSRKLETLWRCLGVPSQDLTSGQIFDLSAAGVGLQMDREFEVGRSMVIRLPTATLGWMSHLVRVRRCDLVHPGVFHVGCTFVKPLSAKDLNALLGQPPGPARRRARFSDAAVVVVLARRITRRARARAARP